MVRAIEAREFEGSKLSRTRERRCRQYVEVSIAVADVRGDTGQQKSCICRTHTAGSGRGATGATGRLSGNGDTSALTSVGGDGGGTGTIFTSKRIRLF
jgi:hypothetical protein